MCLQHSFWTYCCSVCWPAVEVGGSSSTIHTILPIYFDASFFQKKLLPLDLVLMLLSKALLTLSWPSVCVRDLVHDLKIHLLWAFDSWGNSSLKKASIYTVFNIYWNQIKRAEKVLLRKKATHTNKRRISCTGASQVMPVALQTRQCSECGMSYSLMCMEDI